MKRVIVLLLAASMPFAAQAARRSFVLPSSTVLAEPGSYITVDAATSGELYTYDQAPLRLENLTIAGPDGSAVAPENVFTGRFRSSFDVPLKTAGTYRIAVVTNMLSGTYEENGETKRWRGTDATLKTEVPAGAKNLKLTKSSSRNETFASVGKPTVVKPVGTGLEIGFISHPNDLVAGETANLQLLLDGKPVQDAKVTAVISGTRYRDRTDEIEVVSDKSGKFSFTWPEAGLYWVSASVGGPQRGEGGGGPSGPDAGGPAGAAPAAGAKPAEGAKPAAGTSQQARAQAGPGGQAGGPGGQGGPGGMGGGVPRSSYTVVLEVLP